MLRIGVVGAGIMGGHHSRIAATQHDVELVTVVDPDPERGKSLAAALGAGYASEATDLIGVVDAAILAVPSERHADIGIELLEGGLDLLVEKPIATTVDGARRLIETAERYDRILMPGHVERFNPAVAELPRLVNDLIHIDVRRVGPFSPRIDSDVILDLMIHDLDLVMMLVDDEITSVHALSREVYSDSGDFATVLLRFAGGVSATLTASRASQSKQRQIELTQRENVVVADLLRRQVTVHRVEHAEYVGADGPRYRQNSVIEIPYLDGSGEPLAAEQRHFAECVRERRTPMVSGRDGLAALELALRIRADAIQEEAHV